LLVPSIITGYAAAFVLSLNEYLIAFLVAGFSIETLPVKIVNGLRYGFSPTIAAVAVVFILIAATAFTLFAIFGNLLRFLGADPAILEKNA
jgi:putative spermidine/putrescine transport system permease protein